MSYFLNRASQYNTYRPLIGSIFIIEGLIASGKTTLGNDIKNFLNMIGLKCTFISEFKNVDMLNLYISDMKKYAFSFQILMLSKRLEFYRKAQTLARKGHIVFIDRSIYGDISFAEMQKDKGFISEEEWDVYKKLISSEKLLEPTATIFLDVELDTCIHRIKNRGIDSEISGYDIEYLKALRESYMKNLTNYVVINWNKVGVDIYRVLNALI